MAFPCPQCKESMCVESTKGPYRRRVCANCTLKVWTEEKVTDAEILADLLPDRESSKAKKKTTFNNNHAYGRDYQKPKSAKPKSKSVPASEPIKVSETARGRIEDMKLARELRTDDF